MTQNDGGSAFPYNPWNLCKDGKWRKTEKFNGMTLREWYAGVALQGMLAHSRHGHGYHPRDESMHWHDAIAEEAYEIADAMLKERNKDE